MEIYMVFAASPASSAEKKSTPLIIAGPCLAESYELLKETAEFLVGLSRSLGFELVFKASFDKANRTSIYSTRGPGLVQGCAWLGQIKETYACRIITDVHETCQVGPAAAVCDSLQIPAFLCRQTDLLIEAVRSGRQVNIKKGQFMAPAAAKFILDKVREVAAQENIPFNAALTERGSCFGYGDLVVDMRSLAIMADFGAPVIFDITHSTQQPPAGDKGVSGANRQFAPILARAAAATGCLAGFFLEVHPRPHQAKSDAQAQLSFSQAEVLLRQLLPLWRQGLELRKEDGVFAEA
jgi:2-dehydro-3-deoxyphosphooctonate aldolase (KDO 8-P synthase)